MSVPFDFSERQTYTYSGLARRSVRGATRVARFFLVQHNRTGKNTTNYMKLPQNIPKCRKMDQMAIKYTNIFHCKIYPNRHFCFEKIPSGNPATPFGFSELIFLRIFVFSNLIQVLIAQDQTGLQSIKHLSR
jgi:hypothetical protein